MVQTIMETIKLKLPKNSLRNLDILNMLETDQNIPVIKKILNHFFNGLYEWFEQTNTIPNFYFDFEIVSEQLSISERYQYCAIFNFDNPQNALLFKLRWL